MGLWGGSSGFKMAMLKMDSTDSPEKIAAFYRKALAKYGKVLTCSGPGAERPRRRLQRTRQVDQPEL